jgi:uncharacterized protein involved in oxidation of intracellular sulfur
MQSSPGGLHILEAPMPIALIVNSSPYGTEAPYNALRIAEALHLKDEWVELFFMGDGVNTARRGQDPGTAHASLEAMLTGLIEKALIVTLCGTCCRTEDSSRPTSSRVRPPAPSTTWRHWS